MAAPTCAALSLRSKARALTGISRSLWLHLRIRFFNPEPKRIPLMAADITPVELKERLAAGERPFIVDVREPWEHEQSQLPTQTINIPLGDLPNRLDELADYRDQEIILHCRSGARSGTAKAFLQQQGFQHVRNLLGGIISYDV